MAATPLENLLTTLLRQLKAKGLLPDNLDPNIIRDVLNTLKELGLDFAHTELNDPKVKKQLGLALICAALTRGRPDKENAMKKLFGLVFNIDPINKKKIEPLSEDKLKKEIMRILLEPAPANKRNRIATRLLEDPQNTEEDELTNTIRAMFDGEDVRVTGKIVKVLTSLNPNTYTSGGPLVKAFHEALDHASPSVAPRNEMH